VQVLRARLTVDFFFAMGADASTALMNAARIPAARVAVSSASVSLSYDAARNSMLSRPSTVTPPRNRVNRERAVARPPGISRSETARGVGLSPRIAAGT